MKRQPTGAHAHPISAARSLRRWWIALVILIVLCALGLALEFWWLRSPEVEPLPVPTAPA